MYIVYICNITRIMSRLPRRPWEFNTRACQYDASDLYHYSNLDPPIHFYQRYKK